MSLQVMIFVRGLAFYGIMNRNICQVFREVYPKMASHRFMFALSDRSQQYISMERIVLRNENYPSLVHIKPKQSSNFLFHL